MKPQCSANAIVIPLIGELNAREGGEIAIFDRNRRLSRNGIYTN